MNNFALGIYNICLDRSHKLLIFKEYHGEYVASSESELGLSPNPSLACGSGVGGVPIPTTGRKLSTLPTL
jgi:hypothetical protein